MRLPMRGQGRDTRAMAPAAAVVLLVVATPRQVAVLVVPVGAAGRGAPHPVLAGDTSRTTGVRVAAGVGAVADGRSAKVRAAGVEEAVGVGAAGAPRRAGPFPAAATDAAPF